MQGSSVIIEKPLDGPRALCEKLGTEQNVQNNRMNKQIILVVRVSNFPDVDPLESEYNFFERAAALGSTKSEDSLCVYKGENGVQFLSETDMTSYHRFIMQLINPDISASALKLISTHSIRVYACVLLHEARKYHGPYIKLRL